MFIIAGQFRRRRLLTPKGDQTRPTSSQLRECVFNICQNQIEKAAFLDVFAGSGAMGFEALSRGAQSATFIELNRSAIQCIRKNADTFNVLNQCQILEGDVFKLLENLYKRNKQFDIIYLDPPYHQEDDSSQSWSYRLLNWLDTHSLLTSNGSLFIEENHRHAPQIAQHQRLNLKASRRVGPAILQEYQLITKTYS